MTRSPTGKPQVMRRRRAERPDVPDPEGLIFASEQEADAEARRRNYLPIEARSDEPWVATQVPNGDWVLVRRQYRSGRWETILAVFDPFSW